MNYYAVNCKPMKRMDARRGNAFGSYYDDGILPSSKTPDVKHYYKLRKNNIRMVMVRTRSVSTRAQLRSWSRGLGDMFTGPPDAPDQLFDCDCSCSIFNHNNNVCAHVVVIAIALRFVDPDRLINKAQPRRAVGRPRRDNGAYDTTDGAPRQRQAADFLREISKCQTMRFQGHKVGMIVDNATVIGFVWGATLTTPPVHIIQQVGSTDIETRVTWDDAQLAEGLAKALLWGKSGTV